MTEISLAPFDQLLVYLSELGSGSWNRFRGAVQAVSGRDSEDPESPYWVRQNLEALGHIEFSGELENSWSVAPAALVSIPCSHGKRAVLAGSRTFSLLDKVQKLDCENTPQDRGPERIAFYRESDAEMVELAAELGVTWSPRFSELLSRVILSTSELYEKAPENPAPSGWAMWRYEDLQWHEMTIDRVDGFYRYRHFTTEYRLKWAGQCRVLDRSTGIYEFCRRTGRLIVQYDEERQRLTVPQVAGLPPLMARCATMCSGLLPLSEAATGGRRELHYSNIPSGTGKLLRASLT